MPEVVLAVGDLHLEYRSRRGPVKALRGVTFDLYKGETLALIGESGCGKSTLGLALIGLYPGSARITRGSLALVDGANRRDLLKMSPQEVRRIRWIEMAMVLQAALNAFNPVLRIEEHFLDTARAHGVNERAEVLRRARRLLSAVQLDPDRVLPSYPHELSGGMRQRVLLALGLLLEPRILILDEPTTALDILTQRTIIELLKQLKAEFDFTLIFISHDLSLAAELADRVATMYAGRLVEISDVYQAFEHPVHPYTLGLTSAVPTLHGGPRELTSIPGSPPDLVQMPPGCKFHPRCPLADERCTAEDPPLRELGGGRMVACFHWDRVAAQRGGKHEPD
ncbi:MAG TPA: ABC transporter ATP-binding protein [Symbiobacteriaceae bacterium]|nr:ABC transporter ATP-binding protein [Symbiobacteriaceae bacterium]